MTTNQQPLDLGILLAIGYQEFVRALRSAMAAAGFDDLGRSDGYVLRALDGNPLTVSALAELLDITKQGSAQIVDDMQVRGYVERRPSPTDRAVPAAVPDRAWAAGARGGPAVPSAVRAGAHPAARGRAGGRASQRAHRDRRRLGRTSPGPYLTRWRAEHVGRGTRRYRLPADLPRVERVRDNRVLAP